MKEKITDENIYEKVQNHEYIYHLMYQDKIKDSTIAEQISKAPIWRLYWWDNKKGFNYIWGMPGPDFNYYSKDNYGITWAFTKEELFEYWNETIPENFVIE